MKTPEQCLTGLGEYRRDVIGRRQRDVGRILAKQQGYISQLECGVCMPPKWNREKLIVGYQIAGVPLLNDEQFVMLIERSEKWMESERERKAKERAAKQPMSATEPLLASAMADKAAQLLNFTDNVHAPVGGITIRRAQA